MYISCPICDSESVSPGRKKSRQVGANMFARIYVCGNCKHKFIVITAIARGALAAKIEEMLDEVH